MKTLINLWATKLGATSIEYAFIACLLSLLIIVGARTIGLNLSTKYFAPVAANLT